MKISEILLGICFFVLSSSVGAALLSRDLDGNSGTIEAFYDDATNLTWLSDANMSMTSGYDSDGLMTWNEARTWVSLDLNFEQYGGGDAWRLPITPNSDHDCFDWTTAASCYQGEMAQLYFNSMGNTAFTERVYDPFMNVQQDRYWSSNIYNLVPGKPGIGGVSPATAYILTFDMNGGSLRTTAESEQHYAWAVHEGDIGVSIVPVPAAIWMFGSGVIALIGFSKRK